MPFEDLLIDYRNSIVALLNKSLQKDGQAWQLGVAVGSFVDSVCDTTMHALEKAYRSGQIEEQEWFSKQLANHSPEERVVSVMSSLVVDRLVELQRKA